MAFLGLVGLPFHVLDAGACVLAACRGKPLLKRAVVAIAPAPIGPRLAWDAKHGPSEMLRERVEIHSEGRQASSFEWSGALEPGRALEATVEDIAADVVPDLLRAGANWRPDSKDTFRNIRAPSIWDEQQKVRAAAHLACCLLSCHADPGVAYGFVLGLVFPPATVHKLTAAFDLNVGCGDRRLMDALFTGLVAAGGGGEAIPEAAVERLLSSAFAGEPSNEAVRAAFGERGFSSAEARRALRAKGCPALHPLVIRASAAGIAISTLERSRLYRGLVEFSAESTDADFEATARGILEALTRNPPASTTGRQMTLLRVRELATGHVNALERSFTVSNPKAALVQKLALEARQNLNGKS